jgi:glycine/D-amino acid oxidase-like deaminating enzyme/nitrite reductase/ring-hydroxylating ferredoxin subunit
MASGVTMSPVDAIHHSVWREHDELRQSFDRLTDTFESDVAIIGAGITGLSLALECIQRGLTVAIYEASVIGAGTTGASTGHVDASPEMGTSELIHKLGLEAAKEYVQLRKNAIDLIESRAGDCCAFTRLPAYYYSEKIEDEDSVLEQFEAARKLELNAQWPESLPVLHAATGYRIDHMGRIDSLAYARRLANMVTQSGGRIFENSLFKGMKDDDKRQALCGSGVAKFSQIVSCVHHNQAESLRIDMQIPPYQSYALVARINESFPDVLLWDNADPYYYIRRLRSNDDCRIIVGGCDHRTGTGDPINAIAKLREYVFERFDVDGIEKEWSAELFEPTDGLPLIGRSPSYEHLWVATGLSGVGLTLGTMAGAMIAKQITGEKTKLEKELSPSRFSLSDLGHVITEQSQTLPDYAERILPAKTIDADAIPAGEGMVGNYNGTHAAVCRDRDGNLHVQSPICTHMGGVVRWNPFEQTWDCPVHGGRFSKCGSRIYGPPKDPLEKQDALEKQTDMARE